MPANTEDWMAYIDGEVRAVCEALGWGHQIRRKGSARERPVSQSTIDDYEWKLIPEAKGRLPEAALHDFDGVYYVLGFDESDRKFVLQHDTTHVSIMGPLWEQATYTEIRPDPFVMRLAHLDPVTPHGHPPVGWLRDHLLQLVARFGPNDFSNT